MDVSYMIWDGFWTESMSSKGIATTVNMTGIYCNRYMLFIHAIDCLCFL